MLQGFFQKKNQNFFKFFLVLFIRMRGRYSTLLTLLKTEQVLPTRAIKANSLKKSFHFLFRYWISFHVLFFLQFSNISNFLNFAYSIFIQITYKRTHTSYSPPSSFQSSLFVPHLLHPLHKHTNTHIFFIFNSFNSNKQHNNNIVNRPSGQIYNPVWFQKQ